MKPLAIILLLGVYSGPLLSQIGNIVVTNAANFAVELPARGSIGSIFCTGVRIPGPVLAETIPLPRVLAGVSVGIGGAIAPLFSVSDLGGYQQINFQVPQEMVEGPHGRTAVTVTQDGQMGTAAAEANSSTPGEFFTVPNSTYGAFQHASDYSLVTPLNPAHAGETIIGYMTGLSGTVPLVPSGESSPYAPLAIVPQTGARQGIVLEYSVAGSTKITFLGLAPGLVGVYQVNFILSPTVRPGDFSTSLTLHWCNNFCFMNGQGWQISKSVRLPIR